MASAVEVLKHKTSTLRQRHNFISINFNFGVGDNVREVTNSDKVGLGRWAVEKARGGNIYGYYDFCFYILQQSYSPYPRTNFCAHKLKRRSHGVRKTLFRMINVLFWNLGCFTLKTPQNWSQRAITSQNKMSNNSETVRDTRNVSMNHDYETGVAFSDLFNKTCVKRPLAEKLRWLHIRFAIKPRYLRNHAPQTNS